MRIGTRIVNPEEVGRWNAEIVQISVYRWKKNNLKRMKSCARTCRDANIRFVVHPVGYFLMKEEMLSDLREMAECADLALILHDEKTPDGERIEGSHESLYRRVLDELKGIAHISIENATDTRDVPWFWTRFAESVTLDIGHVESSGLDSVRFVKNLGREVMEKIEFVHMHRNNGLHGGITDHWPLLPDCREYRALRELIQRKTNVSVILELNEVDEIGRSLELLAALREEVVNQ
jgi:sugar phosphate isomerase/epimerase